MTQRRHWHQCPDCGKAVVCWADFEDRGNGRAAHCPVFHDDDGLVRHDYRCSACAWVAAKYETERADSHS